MLKDLITRLMEEANDEAGLIMHLFGVKADLNVNYKPNILI
jgi:hypothetical protein